MNNDQLKKFWAEKLNVDEDDIYFFEDRKQPWVGYKSLLKLARDKGLEEVECTFAGYHTEFEKIEWQAAINADGKTYRASGLAGLQEKLATGEKADPDYLAASRALRMALGMAGFDPIRDKLPMTDLYQQQLATIHILAFDLGLIVGKDDSVYRRFLQQRYGVESATELDPSGRADLIERLRSWMQ